VTNKPPEILIIKSETSELKKVEYFLEDIFNRNNLSKKYFNKLYLCVSEAIINAIKHGNRNDLNKKVIIKISCLTHEMEVLIEDEGEGFNRSILQNPTTTENIRKESGRGIFIIENLTDKIEFNEKGNRIQFKIKCSE
jgi:serine/threonine-protein kinase RsbW